MGRAVLGAAIYRLRASWRDPVWRIGSITLAGWAAIIDLAWHLANARISICGIAIDTGSTNCILRATAARDSTIVDGLTAGLSILAILLTIRALKYHRRPPIVFASTGRAAGNATEPTAFPALPVPRPERHNGRTFPLIVSGLCGVGIAVLALWCAGVLQLPHREPTAKLVPVDDDPFAALVPSKPTRR